MTRHELLTLILQEVLRITAHTKYAAYYRYQGHVDSLFVGVATGKEEEEQYNDLIYEADIYMGAGMTDPMHKLQACLNQLKTYV